MVSGGESSSNTAAGPSGSQGANNKSWKQLVLDFLGNTKLPSSKPKPKLTTSIPVPNFQSSAGQSMYKIAITRCQTFGLFYGINQLCAENFQHKYVLHFFAAEEPESRTPCQAPYDRKIPARGSPEDNLVNECWISLSESSMEIWKEKRWGTLIELGHGIKQSCFKQEAYFVNACRVYKFIDLKSKMVEIATGLRTVKHAGKWWHDIRAGALSDLLLRKVGRRPELRFEKIAEEIQTRFGKDTIEHWCLYEVLFMVNTRGELLDITTDYIKGPSEDDRVLF